MAQDIKQKIELTGEKQYNAALKEAQRHLKTLRGELKAETAELGNNATAQEKNRVKSESLRKQIKEQEKVVKTLKEALERAKEEYGNNEEVVAKWENKLNDARTTLANMNNDLDRLSDGIGEVNSVTAEGVTATKNFADAINAIGDAGGNIASALEGTFTTVIDVIKDAIGELWGMIAETAARANEWTDIASIWNTDPAKIEKYARGVQYAGKSFSDLSNAVSKIAGGDAEKIFNLTGVRMIGDGDEWQYAMDVLSSISGMDYQSKLNALQEIFGDKRASGMMDIVNAWSTILEGGDKLTEGGYGLGEGMLTTMNEVQESINMIEASWDALKDHIAGGLGEATLPILLDVQGAMDGIAEYLSAETPEDRQAALDKITENITQFCKDVAAALTTGLEIIGAVGEGLTEDDNPISKAIGTALLALKETLEWLMDESNWDAVKIALDVFFGLWIAGRGAQALSAIAALAANIKTITAFRSLGNITNLFGGEDKKPKSGGSDGGGWFWGVLKNAIPNALAAIGIHEAVKALPANWLMPKTDAQETIDEINKAHGINTLGDVEQQLSQIPQEQTRRTLGFIFDNLLHPGREMDSAAEKIQEAAEVIEEDVEADGGLTLSPADRKAMEDYWDTLRETPWDADGQTYKNLLSTFGDSYLFDEILARLEGLLDYGYEDADLPSWWFSDMPTGEGEGLTSEDISGFKGLPGLIQQAARNGTASGVSGIKVYMDGVAVGHLVAATVSQDIASWTV